MKNLFTFEEPWIHLIKDYERTVDIFANYLISNNKNSIIRILRGNRCKTNSTLFAEFAASLQFPYYFGHNWDALDECISDLEWLQGDAYIFLFSEANKILIEESDKEFQIFIDRLKNARNIWSTTGNDNIKWSYHAIPFNIIFQCNTEFAEIFQLKIKQFALDISILELSELSETITPLIPES